MQILIQRKQQWCQDKPVDKEQSLSTNGEGMTEYPQTKELSWTLT